MHREFIQRLQKGIKGNTAPVLAVGRQMLQYKQAVEEKCPSDISQKNGLVVREETCPGGQWKEEFPGGQSEEECSSSQRDKQCPRGQQKKVYLCSQQKEKVSGRKNANQQSAGRRMP